MSRKIICIGGGKSGKLKPDGTKSLYETKEMDLEILKLSSKDNPNVLFIAHACPSIKDEEIFYNGMKYLYKVKYSCECKKLYSTELNDKEKVNELVNWADIIYESGGNTKSMIELWNSTGFNKVLENAWNEGKVLCGLSAGGICYFRSAISDALKLEEGQDKPYIEVPCLGFYDLIICPHADEDTRMQDLRNIVKKTKRNALAISNCCAIEIVDDKYRFITSSKHRKSIDVFAKKLYFDGKKVCEEYLSTKDDFKPLSNLTENNQMLRIIA